MKDLNVSIITGRLGRDPEIRNGGQLAKFSIACNRAGRKQDDGSYAEGETDWIDCTAFGYSAQRVGAMRKGEKMLVQGELQIDRYTDRDGNKRRSAYIKVARMECVDTRPAQHQPPPPADGEEETPF